MVCCTAGLFSTVRKIGSPMIVWTSLRILGSSSDIRTGPVLRPVVRSIFMPSTRNCTNEVYLGTSLFRPIHVPTPSAPPKITARTIHSQFARSTRIGSMGLNLLAPPPEGMPVGGPSGGILDMGLLVLIA